MNFLQDGEVELWRNDQWRVTNLQMEEIDDGSTLAPYWINLSEIHHPGVVDHVCAKTWVERPLFVEAYRKACDVAGCQPNEEEINRALSEGQPV